MRQVFYLLLALCCIASCARMGSPDGGWYDDTPPRVVSSSPNDKATNVKTQKITINFNEYIKLEDAQNKVIISPPQLEVADIKAAGRRILIELKDSLKDNTTYTIDFSDAITDNNEGNPMGNYTFSFSTDDQIDTLEVAGYALNAENLEPIKGVLVGLYDDLSDTVLSSKPMMRVSRTNGSGRFVIKGVEPGKYRICALQDADGDFIFGQKSEMVAFSHDIIEPTCKPDIRQDTLWRDTLHIDNIVKVGFTHFLPDDVTLLCFQQLQTDRYLLKTERPAPNKLAFYFTYGNDSLPQLSGLNFDSDSAFVVEPSLKNDTIVYWLRDSTLINQDTLTIAYSYLGTDTLGQLTLHTDTTDFLPKVPYEKRVKEQQKEYEKWQKEQEKRKKKGEKYDSIYPKTVEHLKPKISASGQVEPQQQVTIEMPEPLARCDTSGLHLYTMIDSVWYNAPVELRQRSVRVYDLIVDWKEGGEYSLEMDSAIFVGMYGHASEKQKLGLKVRSADEFSTLLVELSGLPAMPDTAQIVVQLLDTGDKLLRQAVAESDNTVTFFYLKPGKYYLRAFIDLNRNGLWDTGQYDLDLQPEDVYYHSEEVECKEKWDVTRRWNLTSTPRFRQKPAAITKQKPDKDKKQKNRNLERAKQIGKEYIQQNMRAL